MPEAAQGLILVQLLILSYCDHPRKREFGHKLIEHLENLKKTKKFLKMYEHFERLMFPYIIYVDNYIIFTYDRSTHCRLKKPESKIFLSWLRKIGE